MTLTKRWWPRESPPPSSNSSIQLQAPARSGTRRPDRTNQQEQTPRNAQPVVTYPAGGMVPGPGDRQPEASDGSTGAARLGGVRKAGALLRSTESRRLSAA